MKIIQISSLYPPNVVGGAEQSVKVISEGLAKLGHEVHVITLQGPEPYANADSDNVTVHEVPLANIYWPWNGSSSTRSAAQKAIWHSLDTANELMARRVAAIVSELRPDIVVTHNLQGFSTAVMPAIKRANIPLVHVIHDYALLCAQTSLNRNGSACGICENRCTACRLLTKPRHNHSNAVDAVIGVSQSVLTLHKAHGLFQNTPQQVIYNALKPSIQIQPKVPTKAPDKVFSFGFLGRVEHSKGIETLLRAAQALELKGLFRFRLLIAGKAEPGYLEHLRKTLPVQSAEYVGYVDAASFLEELDTLIFPSEWVEALGNGVIEAFSQGVPVIGSDVGGIPESINHEINGLVFEAGNAQQLSEHMLELATRPHVARQMASSALKKSHQYLVSNRAQEYNRFLESVISDIATEAAA